MLILRLARDEEGMEEMEPERRIKLGGIREEGRRPRSRRLREEGSGMKGGEDRAEMRSVRERGVFMLVWRRVLRSSWLRVDMFDVEP
jgi:hypothetical protein